VSEVGGQGGGRKIKGKNFRKPFAARSYDPFSPRGTADDDSLRRLATFPLRPRQTSQCLSSLDKEDRMTPTAAGEF